MSNFWHFPATHGAAINSINNAGIETFKGNKLEALTREISQNSIDAAASEHEPVIVEFQSFNIKKDDFPKVNELIGVMRQCGDTWKGKNQKIEEFAEKGIDTLSQEQHQFLRISDFNTKGLEGAETAELGLPWSSLVKEAGSSNKGDSSGGSFGIGKAAPAANSTLRTLFYSSLDRNNYASHIGVSNLMSFKKEDGATTIGNGYFTNSDESKAIPSLLNLDPNFRRNKAGTDIYISGFQADEGWEKEIIHAVLHNFFITIWQKKLIVIVEGITISHENITGLIAQLDDLDEKERNLKAYFEIISSENTLNIPYPARTYHEIGSFEEGEATLYLMEGQELNRRVLMTRKTGMRLFEQKNISSVIFFSGILMITGKRMNTIFKAMENPSHTEWTPSRYEPNPKIAEKVLKDLRKFVRDTVHKEFQRPTTSVMDAVGLSDFLPDHTQLDGDGDKKRETIDVRTKQIVQKKKEKKKPRTKRKPLDDAAIIEEVLIDAGMDGEDTDVLGSGQSDSHDGGDGGKESGGDNPGDGSGTQDGSGSNGENSKKEKREKNRKIDIESRYLCLNKEAGTYRIHLKPEKSFKNGKLAFKVSGEQSDYKLPVLSLNSPDIQNIDIDKHEVRFENLAGKKGITLDIQISYSEYCVLEVEVFEI